MIASVIVLSKLKESPRASSILGDTYEATDYTGVLHSGERFNSLTQRKLVRGPIFLVSSPTKTQFNFYHILSDKKKV